MPRLGSRRTFRKIREIVGTFVKQNVKLIVNLIRSFNNHSFKRKQHVVTYDRCYHSFVSIRFV